MDVKELLEEVERNKEFLKRISNKVMDVLIGDDRVTYIDAVIALSIAKVKIISDAIGMCYSTFDPKSCAEEILDFISSVNELERRMLSSVVEIPDKYLNMLKSICEN